jgi:hypothetical protein
MSLDRSETSAVHLGKACHGIPSGPRQNDLSLKKSGSLDIPAKTCKLAGWKALALVMIERS